MQARGPLMIEHRLIERMLVIIQERLGEVEKTRKIDASFVDTAVDFVRSYADRTHHGKEEDMLFPDMLLFEEKNPQAKMKIFKKEFKQLEKLHHSVQE